jgi:MoxR-like ATPase
MTFLKAAKQVDTTAKNNGSHALQSHEITSASTIITRLIQNIETVIFGKREVVEGCLIGLLAGGHILLEDVPGVGKTMLARSLAKSLGATYKRIQFTPDLLPSDVTGSLVFDQSSSKFHFREGPIFANIVLADEINRTSPKTQSALLECMEEGQITADLVTHLLPRPFFVIATQNPTEYEGVFPLPESQLDRFIIRLSIGYPAAQAEKALLCANSASTIRSLKWNLSPLPNKCWICKRKCGAFWWMTPFMIISCGWQTLHAIIRN